MGYARNVFAASFTTDIGEEQGSLEWVDKESIEIDRSYQRDETKAKVKEIAARFSWVAFGVLIIGVRQNGSMFVIDGQHRLLAAMLRDDISSLPCILFRTTGRKQEAGGFLDANDKRKPISSYAKFHAACTAAVPTAEQVKSICKSLGVEVVQYAHSAGQCKCIGTLLDIAAEDESRLARILEIARDVCNEADEPIRESFLKAFVYIDKCVEGGVSPRMATKLKAAGYRKLLQGIQSSQSFHDASGARIGAIGVLKVINKGMRRKWELAEKGEAK